MNGIERRICPVCAGRYAQVVDQFCIVCHGAGVLILGDGALAIYEPAVVAQTIVLALEAVAREADNQLTLSDDRTEPIRQALHRLTAAGILGVRLQPANPKLKQRPRKRDTAGRYMLEVAPSRLAEECVQEKVFDIDATLSAAGQYTYKLGDRPNARGLPLLSANGGPSHLARVCDPEPAGAATWEKVRSAGIDAGHADALLAAVPGALEKRATKQKRQGRQ